MKNLYKDILKIQEESAPKGTKKPLTRMKPKYKDPVHVAGIGTMEKEQAEKHFPGMEYRKSDLYREESELELSEGTYSSCPNCGHQDGAKDSERGGPLTFCSNCGWKAKPKNQMKYHLHQNIDSKDHADKLVKTAKSKGASNVEVREYSARAPASINKMVKKYAVSYHHTEPAERDWSYAGASNLKEEAELEESRDNFKDYNKWKKEVEKRGYKLTHSATQVTAHDDKTKKQMGVFRHSTYGSEGHLLNEAVETKLQMTMPLFIRLLEWAKEECKTDVEIHQVAEKIAAVNGVADMDNYEELLK